MLHNPHWLHAITFGMLWNKHPLPDPDTDLGKLYRHQAHNHAMRAIALEANA
jgi:hypothetical protein